MVVQGNFAPLFRLGLREDFGESLEQYEAEYPQFLKTSSTDMPEQRASIITGLNRLVELGDGEPITFDNPIMGPVVQGVDREWGIGFSISRRTIEDDQYNKANQAAKWLGNAVNQTYEYRGASLLDDAFTGSTYLGIDGLRLCHTAHTLIGNTSTTVANQPATAIGFSQAGVAAIMELFANFKDQNGDPIKAWPTKFVIGNDTSNINKAVNIFGNDKEPFTADNTDNVVKKRIGALKPVVAHYMTNKKYYFGIDEKYNDAQFVMRRKALYEEDFDFGTSAHLNKVTTRFLIWFVFWWGWAGVNATT